MNNYLQLSGLILLCVLLLLTAVFFTQSFPKEKDKGQTIRRMSADAVLIALIVIMTFVPNMGFIFVTPFLSFTLLHIPVLVGACLFGAKRGAFYGLVFGVCSMIQAMLQGAGFNLLFIYPWTAIPPRLLFGFIAGLVFSFIRKISHSGKESLYLALAAAGLTVLHTGLVFLDLYIFFPTEVAGYLSSSSPLGQGTALTFLTCILLGAAGETGLAAFLTPALYLALRKAGLTEKTEENHHHA